MKWKGRSAVTMLNTSTMYLFLSFALSLAVSSAEQGQANLRGMSSTSSMVELHPRIVGGHDVVPSENRYPYFSLMWGRSICGGALITPSIVLTAAHCANVTNKIRIGVHSRMPNAGDNPEVIFTDTKLQHPNYVKGSLPDDIMVVKLLTPSTKPYLQMNKNTSLPIDGQELYVIGFGDTDPGPDVVVPSNLQEVDVDYVPHDNCTDIYGNSTYTKDMMCALEIDKDACSGDSGGPLIIRGEEPGDDLLVGTVSWGRGCANNDFPGVYSRISYFYDWIVNASCYLSPDDAPDSFGCQIATAAPSTSSSPSVPPTEEPTEVPTTQPSAAPTRFPTSVPSPAPTTTPTTSPEPSAVPTPAPSPAPSSVPTPGPTGMPSSPPSPPPTAAPTPAPSGQPTVSPAPTAEPSSEPSAGPTSAPSARPTGMPSASPSAQPTSAPSPSPSSGPTVSPAPTPAPSSEPSAKPTRAPSAKPTGAPSSPPTGFPTPAPTPAPSAEPTVSPAPTAEPSPAPSAAPTMTPSYKPTGAPTSSPSASPTGSPTPAPSVEPTTSAEPTRVPSPSPSTGPTSIPTEAPTSSPTLHHSGTPTSATLEPTSSPTPNPSEVPPSPGPSPRPTPAPSSPPVDVTAFPTTSPVATDTIPTSSPTTSPVEGGSLAPVSPAARNGFRTSPTAGQQHWIDWYPADFPLQHCEGNCGGDWECAGSMVCFQTTTGVVPGCTPSDEKYIPTVAGFCAYLEDY